jgi:hypothetical protein
VEGVVKTAKTAWEALPLTGDEASTTAARERIGKGVLGTLDGMATLIGPSAEEIITAHETGNPDAMAYVEQRQQEQKEMAKALGDGVEQEFDKVHERSGTAGVAGAVAAATAIGVAGSKGAGAVGKLGGDHTPDVTSVADEVGAANKLKQLPPLRQAYVNEVNALGDIKQHMYTEGMSSEQIARNLHPMRRDLGVKYKDMTPEPMREEIYARNLQKYGDKLGPSVDWLRARGKSWEQIIESACRSGGKDLGF